MGGGCVFRVAGAEATAQAGLLEEAEWPEEPVAPAVRKGKPQRKLPCCAMPRVSWRIRGSHVEGPILRMR